MQMLYMIIIAILAGLFAAGVVWVFWENGIGVQKKIHAWREKRMLKAEAAALMEQANDSDDAPQEQE